MKGRNTTGISIRVSDSVYTILQELANKRGVSISAYVKAKVEDYIARLVNTHSVITTNSPIAHNITNPVNNTLRPYSKEQSLGVKMTKTSTLKELKARYDVRVIK